MKTKIVIASDHTGITLKSEIIELLSDKYYIKDLGTDSAESVDYPDFAKLLCEYILDNSEYKGILICGTGIGMSIVANRFSGIKAALCHSLSMAQQARMHLDANVLVLGSKIVNHQEAISIIDKFFSTSFEGGRHIKRLNKFD